MAQTVDIRPVIVQQDDSLQRFAQSLELAAQEKQKRQLAVQDAILKQRNTNNAIFGDAVKTVREYYDNANGLPQKDRDEQFLETMRELEGIPPDSPEYQKLVVQGVNKAATKTSAAKNYFAASESVIKELSDKGYKINPDAVRQFANTFIYDFKTEDNTKLIEGLNSGALPPPAGMTKDEAIAAAMAIGPRQVKVRKDLSSIQDPAIIFRQEIFGHPELYADVPGVKEAAFGELDKTLKGLPKAGGALTLDPTGKRTLNLGTEYTMSVFDKLEDNIDDVTGLKYKKPRLNITKLQGMFHKGGDEADVLGEEEYGKLMRIGKNIQQDVMISAIKSIREHNAEAFRRAGVANPDQAAMSVSKNNASQFSQVPDFANPFDEGILEKFQRSAAADLLKDSGRYNNDGYLLGFQLNRGDKTANPSAGVKVTVDVQGPGMPTGFVDLWPQIVSAVDKPNPIGELDQQALDAILKTADNLSIFRGGRDKVLPEMVTLGRDPQGRVRIYLKDKNGKPDTSIEGVLLSPQGIARMAAPEGKNETFAAGKNTLQNAVITKEQFKKMSVADRSAFRQSGGKVEGE